MTVFPIRLEPWEELVGYFHELREDDGYIVAKIGPTLIVLPLELKQELQSHLGCKIDILRTDCDYRMRVGIV